jgi:hypothetical protein
MFFCRHALQTTKLPRDMRLASISSPWTLQQLFLTFPLPPCLISGYTADFTPRCSSDDRYSALRRYVLLRRQGHHNVSITHAVTS